MATPGRMTVANGAYGSISVNSTVLSSISVTDSRNGSRHVDGLYRQFGLLAISYVCTTSAAVTGSPLWNVASRRVHVHTSPSSLVSHRSSARSGTGVSVGSYLYRPVPMKPA